MNKKGLEINIIFIIKLLAVLLVGSIAFSKAFAYAKKDTITKTNTAEDLRMMVDTLVGVPGDAVVRYPYNVSEYSFILSQGSVSVFKKGEAVNLWMSRSFFLPKEYIAQGVVEGKSRLCLEKKNKQILLKECSESLSFSQPSVPAGKAAWKAEAPQSIKDKFEPGFMDKVNSVSAELGINSNYLLAVMYFETGGTFSPAQKSIAGSGATGLIQFMPKTAVALGTSTEELAKMTQVQQMNYVKKYFELNNGRNAETLSDTYMVVLYPAAVGKPEDYVLFRKGTKSYDLNPLDWNEDGIITKEEASLKVAAAYEKVTGGVIS
ncbi:MAG: hypothetical protein AB1668_03780 [Nanoarchaeota archaeon]